jgi:hypothetical protein
MYQQLLAFLKHIAEFRYYIPQGTVSITSGSPSGTDGRNDFIWIEFTLPDSLYHLWGPDEESPWRPFHCATLFAALDIVKKDRLGPLPCAHQLPYAALSVNRPPWLDEKCLLFLDLPGADSVAVAAALSMTSYIQTICTFDNWPHERGLLKPERTLSSLLYYSPFIKELKLRYKENQIRDPLIPVWVCDSERLGTRSGSPREFDNRYFLDDSLLPGSKYMLSNGINTVVYVSEHKDSTVVPDLNEYFKDLVKEGIQLKSTYLHSEKPLQSIHEGVNFRAQVIIKGSFFRSSAGGFGAPVPEPSSSSG